MKKIIALALALCNVMMLYCQEDSTVKELGEVVLSANKWEQKLNEVPNRITKITKAQILRNNPQTAADLLSQTGAVFIQKSQLGGGSPMIRGFATNRVLIVFDGVRLNNAIYRSGNLQNVISIDALSTEAAEVIFGPGSIVYGSDAIGGVMDFHSLEARFSNDSILLVRGSAITRYSTANDERTIHADINLGWKKWSLLSSFTYSKFDDLLMGKHSGDDSYLRKEYIERIIDTDSIIENNKPRIQRFTGYDQFNFLQKIRFKPGPHSEMQYSFVYGGTGNAPRYDRLIQYRNGALRFAEWYYGPMLWRMHILQALHSRSNRFFDESRLTIAYQDYAESRIERTRNNITKYSQSEKVDAFSLNWDATKEWKKNSLYYGLEYVFNKVGSKGTQTNITNAEVDKFVSRYPDGSTTSTAGVYASYKRNPHPSFTITSGLRFNYNTLKAEFDTGVIHFPYTSAELKKASLTGNAGLVYRPVDEWQFQANISTGFRMPNIDDIGKLFESEPGNVIVPNPGLKSEYAWNFESGISWKKVNLARIELNIFYTLLDDAIVRRPYTFNGDDSILFQGTLSQVLALQNAARAHVWGIQAAAELFFQKNFSFQLNANWIQGKETDEETNEQVPLRHAPPFFGTAALRYRWKKIFLETFLQYNNEVRTEDLAPSERAKPEIYAKDRNGLPYSPSWYTLNVRGNWQVTQKITIAAGWENITNIRYRPYSSGIVAPGSNLVCSTRVSF